MKTGVTLTIGIVLLFAGTCASQTSLQVQRGWGGKERVGRWNPVVVRASNPIPRDVMLQLIAANEAGFAVDTREHVAIGPTAATFELFAPSHHSPWENGVAVLRDAQTERAIAQFPQHIRQSPPSIPELGPQGILIGITGKQASLDILAQSGIATTAYLPPRLLPHASIGYDSLEVLFLNQPNLDDLDAIQQQVILDWVRAGGSLLFAPGDGPLSQNSAILAALPCRIGQITPIDLSPATLQQAGLQARFAHLTGRILTPSSPTAQPVELFTDVHVTAWSTRYGLGRILVAPIDLTLFRFDPREAVQREAAFWTPILSQLAAVPSSPPRKFNAPYYGYQSESEDEQREGAATSTLCDFLEGHSGTPSRPIPLALLGILLVIGPVDSVVLFVLGRHPWTWVTTAGWIGLVVACVAYGTALTRHGPVELGSVQVIDQVDDATVATAGLVALHSASGGAYSIEPSAGDQPGWWQAAVPGIVAPQEVRPQPDAVFHQTDSGNKPQPQILRPGQSRYLRSDGLLTGPAIFTTSLSLHNIETNSPHLIGSITNISARALKNLRIRTRQGVTVIPLGPSGALLPHQTVPIDLATDGEPFTPTKLETRYQSFGYFGSHHDRQPINEADLWAVAPDLSARRSLRIDELIQNASNFACIYAEIVDPVPTATLAAPEQPIQRYYQWVRALVPLVQ